MLDTDMMERLKELFDTEKHAVSESLLTRTEYPWMQGFNSAVLDEVIRDDTNNKTGLEQIGLYDCDHIDASTRSIPFCGVALDDAVWHFDGSYSSVEGYYNGYVAAKTVLNSLIEGGQNV